MTARTDPVVATFTRYPEAFALVMPLQTKVTAPRDVPAWATGRKG